jgi:hypothetical protein
VVHRAHPVAPPMVGVKPLNFNFKIRPALIMGKTL